MHTFWFQKSGSTETEKQPMLVFVNIAECPILEMYEYN